MTYIKQFVVADINKIIIIIKYFFCNCAEMQIYCINMTTMYK